MDAFLNLPKKGEKIYTIERCKIEEYFITSIIFHRKPDYGADRNLNQDIEVNLERYNDGVNSYQTSKRLSDVFSSKEDLINQLNG